MTQLRFAVFGLVCLCPATLFAQAGNPVGRSVLANVVRTSVGARDTARPDDAPNEDPSGIPLAPAATVGMSAARLTAIDHIVQRGIAAGGYPGAAVVVGRKGYAVFERGYGKLDRTADGLAVDPATSIYDLASLTKVVATTTAVMVLYDQGRIDLDAPVHRYLPTFSGGAKDAVTIRQLLEHRGGLPAGRSLWLVAHSPAEARAVVLETPLEYAPGTKMIYSDLGADLLGMAVESITGVRLDQFLNAFVFDPLGMSHTTFLPPVEWKARIAPTEINPPRGYPLRGEVHDENAYALGGVAGHAGLFSSAADLAVFAQMLLNGGTYDSVRVLSESTVRLFTHRAAGTRALGWDTCETDAAHGSCGTYMTDGIAFGHTGYTGTSLWIDPDRELFVILLTNRVHAAIARRPARVIADVRADLADAAVLAVTDDPDGILPMPDAFRADGEDGWNTPRPPRHVRGRLALSRLGRRWRHGRRRHRKTGHWRSVPGVRPDATATSRRKRLAAASHSPAHTPSSRTVHVRHQD
jgi:CubicO group peptidase (beta-lactamase class C family)